ncbi:MAG TPA: DUF6585 family protein [Polyangiaceae bacterium]|nr:DUF6585 family protein [Polyangiaceae bacterium]
MQPGPQFQPQVQALDAPFGPVVSEYQVGGKRYWLLFGLLLFLCAVALAGFIAVLAEGSLLGAAILGSLVAGIVLLLVVLSGVQVVVYTHGIERRGRFGSKRLAWQQLQSYTLNIVDPAHVGAGAGGVLGVLIVRLFTSNEIKPQSVVLRGKGGEKVTIPSQLKEYDALLTSLIPYLADRLAAHVHHELSRGVPVPFGKRLSLDPQAGIVFSGLLGGKQNLLFREVDSMVFERASLAIRRRGESKPWQTVPIAAVPNVGVLQRIVAQASPPRPAAPPSGDQYGWAR